MNQQAPPSSGSRETRMLLATIAVSLLMLFVLARFRFPGNGPVETAEPAPAPLERLASQASYDELASTMADLDRRVRPGLMVVRVEPGGTFLTAARVTPDRAVLRLEAGQVPAQASDAPPAVLLGRDPVTGIAVISVSPDPDNIVTPRSGTPRAGPRYIAVADASRWGIAFRPAYVGGTSVIEDSATGRPLLSMSTAPQAVAPGSALFTFAGTFIGIASAVDGFVTIAPADALKALAEDPPQSSGIDLGIDVQPLTDGLARLAGTAQGVMVTAVTPEGPAAGLLAPGDVVQSVDGRRVTSPEELDAVEQTRTPGGSMRVTFVRRGKAETVQIESRPVPAEPQGEGSESDLGLTIRTSGGRAVVTLVQPRSAGARAGLVAGDVILAVDGKPGADLTRAFRAVAAGGGLLVTIERGGRPHIVALEKR